MERSISGLATGRATKARGFTLIELLVVIAIIAILAAILFPVFGQAKKKAHQADCISNLRQMAMAVSMYAEEWRSYPLHSFKEMGQPGYRWMNTLIPYHGNSTGMFVCKTAAKAPADLLTSSQVYGYNYQYLGNGRSRGGQLVPWRLATDAMIEAPSQTVAILDSGGLRSAIGTVDEQKSGYAVDPPSPNPEYGQFYGGSDRSVPRARHSGGVNAAFCDGRVALVRLEELEKDSRYWNGRATPEP